eukprot:g38974.t1
MLWECEEELGVKEEWSKVSRRERSLRNPDKAGERDYMPGGGIPMEVVGMAANDPLDLDAGGMSLKTSMQMQKVVRKANGLLANIAEVQCRSKE